MRCLYTQTSLYGDVCKRNEGRADASVTRIRDFGRFQFAYLFRIDCNVFGGLSKFVQVEYFDLLGLTYLTELMSCRCYLIKVEILEVISLI